MKYHCTTQCNPLCSTVRQTERPAKSSCNQHINNLVEIHYTTEDLRLMDALQGFWDYKFQQVHNLNFNDWSYNTSTSVRKEPNRLVSWVVNKHANKYLRLSKSRAAKITNEAINVLYMS